MNAKYAKPKQEMLDLAAKLGGQVHLFNNDPHAQQALQEAIDALRGSAAQMRSAWMRHSNEPNPLTTSK